MSKLWLVILLFAPLILSGCFLGRMGPATVESVPPVSVPSITPVAPTTPVPASTITVFPWTDETTTASGICFEAALDAAGQVFVLRSSLDHIRFYELADNSGLCRHPVQRFPFDFASGRVLAGLWSAGTGCTARHDVLGVERDDSARTLTIRLHFVTEGDCPYELVRPFWIGLDGVSDYDIQIEVQ